MLISALACVQLDALTLADLLNDPKLTPKRFAAYFGDFDYEYSAPIQPAEEFLARRKGDCDDYAILADFVLRKKQYGTRLIHIRMVGQVNHAVCYVTQLGAYLDYNNRVYVMNLERCRPRLRAIATEVADSFAANWTSVSEYTYTYDEDIKHFGATVVKTEPPETDPDLIPHTNPDRAPQ